MNREAAGRAADTLEASVISFDMRTSLELGYFGDRPDVGLVGCLLGICCDEWDIAEFDFYRTLGVVCFDWEYQLLLCPENRMADWRVEPGDARHIDRARMVRVLRRVAETGKLSWL